MKKMLSLMLMTLFMMPVSGCSSYSERQQAGAVMGGALGGVLGSNVGRGEGRTAAIIAGTLLGAVIGSEIGSYMDKTDELQAQRALEMNRDMQASQWRNPNTGADFSTMPTSTYQQPSGQYCREYQTDIVVNGRKEVGYGTACRQPDGSWSISR
ncbi:Surface antigen [Mariprofundus ferrinatatus]|uniref:Surface antigen n=1 Tax=Mariprofundus ferrinatatus TaxID=1921087 RepID=A0A2K8L244_9PROT|nr:RT0821/Lpp0805 family surface protein [Mariprofundus ferrinatatus]ATX81313.1 Surface antigen [Mariprofundus ferrinatatus]